MSQLKKLLFLCLINVAVFTLAQPVLCAAQTERKAEEYYIKAGYIYRFVHFVDWPEIVEKEVQKDSKEITFGILGEDPFKNFFDKLDGSVISEKKKQFKVERLGPFKPDLDLKKYDLLFICSSEQNNLHEIMNLLGNAPVITIGEMDDFCENGGMIRFVTIKNRVRFEVNHNKAQQAGLVVSSTLLKAALRVIQSEEP